MKIAIFGSWRRTYNQIGDRFLDNKGSQEDFIQVAQQITSEVVSYGHQFIVASDSDSTVDYHVVTHTIKQFANQTFDSAPLVVVRHKAPRSSRTPSVDCSLIFEEEYSKYPNMIQFDHFESEFEQNMNSSDQWTVVHDYIIDIADAIIVLGGSSSSHRSANQAIAKGKYVLLIGVFGGAGQELLETLNGISDKPLVPQLSYRHTLAENDWKKKHLDIVMYSLGIKDDPKRRHKIFISYRRSDSAMATGRIYDWLTNEFGSENVFYDVETIGKGRAFDEEIEAILKVSAVLLAIIGDKWETVTDDDENIRLHDAKDYVRQEVATALSSDILVIPVLIDHRKVPSVDNLPDDLKTLHKRNAHYMKSDTFRADIISLVQQISDELQSRLPLTPRSVQ